MSRRAALYRVSVHARGAAPLPLGDLDGNGSSAVTALAGILGRFSEESDDGSRLVRSLSTRRDGDDLFAIVQYGQKGVAADIVSPAGSIRLRQSPADEQLVRCGCLFRLPAAATTGSLAVEIDDGRGIKGLVEQALTKAFRSSFPDLVLSIRPAADPEALRAAVKSGGVDKVQLERLEPAGGRTIPDVGKWVAPGTAARVRLEIAGASRGDRIRNDAIDRYLDGDAAAFAELTGFAGITFDTVRVGVELPDATRRVFDLARPAAGRAADRELVGVELDAGGQPTDETLAAALRSVLDGS